MYETAEATAPAWFWFVALGAFPASLLVVWLLGFLLPTDMSDEAAEWWTTKGFYYIPIAGGIATGALLLYGANTWG